jgi:choline-phosphate cytidylyltransferase
MDNLKTKGKRVLESFDEKRLDIIHKWEDNSKKFIHSFLLLFGRDGQLSNIWNQGRGKILNALSPPGSPRRNGDSSSNSSDGRKDDEDEDQPPPRKTPRLTTVNPITANSASISPDSSFHSAKDMSIYTAGNYSDDDE